MMDHLNKISMLEHALVQLMVPMMDPMMDPFVKPFLLHLTASVILLFSSSDNEGTLVLFCIVSCMATDRR